MRPVSDEDMACWEETAAQSISVMVPEGINWPMIVLPLIEEIKSLKHDNAMLMEAATNEVNNG